MAHCEKTACLGTLADDDSCACPCAACKVAQSRPVQLYHAGYWYQADDAWCILRGHARTFSGSNEAELARVMLKYPRAWPVVVRGEGEAARHCGHPVDCLLYNSRTSDRVPCECGCPDCFEVNLALRKKGYYAACNK